MAGWGLPKEQARRDLERKSSERYTGFVVRSWLKRVPNEAVKSNSTAREEEVRRFPDQYINSVKSQDGPMLRANREIRDAFRTHIHDRFARCPNLPFQEFRHYLADFLCLVAAEAASCEGVIAVSDCVRLFL